MKYSFEKTGAAAGKVWNYLNENGATGIKAMVDNSELKKDEVLLALGWLFREEKIGSEKKGRTIVFFLK
ncbi:winged helix-turn-helix domain-containing protein [Haliovirga abyssi]|uniref:Winged helix-turn-helix domain-containing protein n=1 Tax=Haliovirga abyssi TaxID=2996794 RepID=A0AAU9D863_9FUSO|nr:winged helix-turn-helix domain-containing protein [Haliovirga abyssi]BDU50778.1 hypothetical protein HLVA_13470 [Haliovirga abyssi]